MTRVASSSLATSRFFVRAGICLREHCGHPRETGPTGAKARELEALSATDRGSPHLRQPAEELVERAWQPVELGDGDAPHRAVRPHRSTVASSARSATAMSLG